MKKLLVLIGLVLAGALIWWFVSPLFINVEVQDELDPALEARLRAQAEVDARATKKQGDTKDKPADGSVESIQKDQSDNTEIIPEVFSAGPFPITGTSGHPASGDVEVIYSPEETLLRFLDYQGTNGPDLRIYLASDLEASEFIDLGPAKGNQGNLIYGVPLDVDLGEYPYVLTWCRAFGVLFDSAKIN